MMQGKHEEAVRKYNKVGNCPMSAARFAGHLSCVTLQPSLVVHFQQPARLIRPPPVSKTP